MNAFLSTRLNVKKTSILPPTPVTWLLECGSSCKLIYGMCRYPMFMARITWNGRTVWRWLSLCLHGTSKKL